MSGFLLDTNVVSDLRKSRPNAGLAAWLDAVDELRLFLSVVTIGELRIGIAMHTDRKKRADLEGWLVSDVLSRFEGRLLPFDLAVAERWGRIEGQARLGGGKLPVVDALVAATALHYDLTVVTHNAKNFARMGVATVDPST